MLPLSAEAIDHDRLFKELLTTFFVEFVDLFMPDVSRYLRRSSLQFLDKELFTDVTAGETHEANLVVKARFRDQDAFFLIHVENQATPQAAFGQRMFRYFARLHEKHNLPVYPVVIFSYDAPARPEPDRYRVEFPDFVVMDFAYRVIQLNRLNWRDYVKQKNPVASALMAKMRIEAADRPKVKVECLRLLATLRLNPAKMRLISGFIDTYLSLSAEEMRPFLAELETLAPARTKEKAMNIVTSWMREGIQQGTENTVLRQLRRQVGEIDAPMQTRIHALQTPELEELADALLDFRSMDDLTAWLDTQPAAKA